MKTMVSRSREGGGAQRPPRRATGGSPGKPNKLSRSLSKQDDSRVMGKTSAKDVAELKDYVGDAHIPAKTGSSIDFEKLTVRFI